MDHSLIQGAQHIRVSLPRLDGVMELTTTRHLSIGDMVHSC
jgi:hypothetical protein